MQTLVFRFLCALAILAAAGAAHAQKVEVTAKTAAVQTPQFNAPNVPAKNWRPKNWLEVDVGLLPRAGGKTEQGYMIDTLEVKVWVGTTGVNPTSRKYAGFSGTFNVLNVPAHGVEHSHLLIYVSPSTLARALGKNDFTPGDIKGVAVEVSKDGNVFGVYNSVPGKKWWEDPTMEIQDGALLPKMKTPFAPLWGDYDLEVKSS